MTMATPMAIPTNARVLEVEWEGMGDAVAEVDVDSQ